MAGSADGIWDLNIFFYMFTISTMVLLSDNLEAKKPKLSAQAVSLRKLNKHKLSCAERQK